MKNENISWENGKIQGELKKLKIFFLSALYKVHEEKQLRKILKKYITYFNQKRPHQGISQEVPEGYVPQKQGKVVSHPVLWGLHHHYYKLAA